MKNLTAIITLAILSLGTVACSQKSTFSNSGLFGGETIKASKNYVTKDLKVDNFTQLKVAGSPDVTYTQKEGKPEVQIYTSDNIVDLLDIYVKDNTLHVGFKKNTNISYDQLEIRISAEKLNGMSVAGSGAITLANGLKTDELKMSIAGSGDIQGNNISCTDLSISIAGSGDINSSTITCNNLSASISGSGEMQLDKITATSAKASIAGSGGIKFSGTTEEATYSIAGSGDLSAADFQAKRISANVTGSGDIECYVTDLLKARTTGSGSIGYKGDPKEIDYPKRGLHKL